MAIRNNNINIIKAKGRKIDIDYNQLEINNFLNN